MTLVYINDVVPSISSNCIPCLGIQKAWMDKLTTWHPWSTHSEHIQSTQHCNVYINDTWHWCRHIMTQSICKLMCGRFDKFVVKWNEIVFKIWRAKKAKWDTKCGMCLHNPHSNSLAWFVDMALVTPMVDRWAWRWVGQRAYDMQTNEAMFMVSMWTHWRGRWKCNKLSCNLQMDNLSCYDSKNGFRDPNLLGQDWLKMNRPPWWKPQSPI
jgi:hypothetical protein